ncbi:MAG: TIGR02710 family CRISPR-associated CARF protein [Candidatus Diapherotrites archaeon]
MKVLFVTIGKPSEKEEHNRPEIKTLQRYDGKVNKIYLIATNETKKFAEKLKNEHAKKTEIEILEVEPDDYEKIIQKLETIEDLQKTGKKIFNITGGTKPITTATTIIATKFNGQIEFEGGLRNEKGFITINTRTKKLNTYNQKKMLLIKELFEKQTYNSCLKLFNKKEEAKNEMIKLVVEAFYEWDSFDHQKAINKIKEFEKRQKTLQTSNKLKETKIIPNLKKYIKILEKLNGEDKEKKKYLILDLYYNALRRANEKKYDDAVARMYRAIEAIAQLRLETKYDIISGNVSLENEHVKKLDEKTKEYLKNKEDLKKKIKIGLKDCYRLLKELKDEHYEKFWEKIEKSPLELRNNSILAHGYKPIQENEFKKMKDFTEEFIQELKKEYTLKETLEFPKKINIYY